MRGPVVGTGPLKGGIMGDPKKRTVRESERSLFLEACQRMEKEALLLEAAVIERAFPVAGGEDRGMRTVVEELFQIIVQEDLDGVYPAGPGTLLWSVYGDN
jgi:hypothetical protein